MADPTAAARRATLPATGPAAVLAALGVRHGSVLVVHASLRGSGLRDTDLLAVLRALLGPEGTLVVPTFTPENSDSSRVHRAAVAGMSEQEALAYRGSMPPYERDSTGCPTMGLFAECVRSTPGAVRSDHPQTSFAALGRDAAELLGRHDLDCHLGERSPLARLYAAAADVLLFRVGFEACSAFHLAEYRARRSAPVRDYRCVVGEKGNWVSYRDVALSDHDFGAVGASLPPGLVRQGELAGRALRMFGMRTAVDHAATYLAVSRS